MSNWSYCGSLLRAVQVQFVDIKWVGVRNVEPNCRAIRDTNLPDCRPVARWVVSDFSEINICPCIYFKRQTLHQMWLIRNRKTTQTGINQCWTGIYACVSTMNINNGIKDPTWRYQNLNTGQILIFDGYLKVEASLYTQVIIWVNHSKPYWY